MNLMPTIQDKRPPFVRFDLAEYGTDVKATEEQGRPIPRTIHMAYITPHGSKDQFEQPAEEWLKRILEKATRDEYPMEWAQHFNTQFQHYLKGNELPRSGTPIKTWVMLTTNEPRRRLISMGITTVEDLAVWPDSGLNQIGLDGRYLRDLAKGWMDEAKDRGINAKALADANAKVDRLEQRLESQNKVIETLSAKINALTIKQTAEV